MSEKSSANAKSRLEKARQTNLEKYGVENPFQAEEVKAKIRQTSIDRHGGIGNGSKEIADKISKTKEKKYGNPKFTNRENVNILAQKNMEQKTSGNLLLLY